MSNEARLGTWFMTTVKPSLPNVSGRSASWAPARIHASETDGSAVNCGAPAP